MDWATILKTVIGAGIGTAVVQAAVAFWQARTTKADRATYAAMRLAVTLEAYGYEISEWIDRNANAYQGPDDQFPHWDVGIPKVPEFHIDDDGWRALEPNAAMRALGLRNRVIACQSIIMSIAEHSEDDLGDELPRHGAERGLEAWDIAKALRARYRLGEADQVWDYASGLEMTLAKAKRSIAESNERSARSNAEMMARHEAWKKEQAEAAAQAVASSESLATNSDTAASSVVSTSADASAGLRRPQAEANRAT